MELIQCSVCGADKHIDEANTENLDDIRYEDLPDEWVCQTCGGDLISIELFDKK